MSPIISILFSLNQLIQLFALYRVVMLFTAGLYLDRFHVSVHLYLFNIV